MTAPAVTDSSFAERVLRRDRPVVVDGFKPAPWDYIGSAVCLLGTGVIVLAPILQQGAVPPR
jgi:hypothetical protein